MNALSIIMLAIFCALGGYVLAFFVVWKELNKEKESSYREGFFDGQQVPDKDFLDEYYEEGYKDGYKKAGGNLDDLKPKKKEEYVEGDLPFDNRPEKIEQLIRELDDIFGVKEQPKGKNYKRYCEKNNTIILDGGCY